MHGVRGVYAHSGSPAQGPRRKKDTQCKRIHSVKRPEIPLTRAVVQSDNWPPPAQPEEVARR